ncbi:lysosomal acid phosphatase-like isoform X2 [Rhopilema esculentum]
MAENMANTLKFCLEILVIFLCLISNFCFGEKSLLQAHVLYRHGDRSPVLIFPTDKHKDFWPDGPGRLTQKGMQMEFELGKFLRNRYVSDEKFVSSFYLHKEVYCKSSDSERCLMSAESQMAGLYPPRDWQVWNKNISWQPIPVHTVPGDKDPLLRPWDAICPRLSELKREKKQNKEYIVMEEYQKGFLEKLEKNTGLSALDLTSIWSIRDTLFVEKSHNLSWPSWVTDGVWNNLNFLYFWGFKYMFTGNDEFSRLSGGSLIKSIIANMEAKSKGKTETFKLNIYSAHDTTILALLGSLGLYNATDIPYASAVLVELYEDSGKYSVELYYRNSTAVGPYQLHLSNCEKQCELGKFVSLLQSRVPKDYGKECGNIKDVKK